MTSLVVAVEVGAAQLSFAYGEHPGSDPPTVGRILRPPRPVAPGWHTGASVYVEPGPATAELALLYSTICGDGAEVARFGLVCPDRSDRPAPQDLPSAASFLQKVRGGAGTQNRGQPHIWGETRNWVVGAGFPEPSIVGKAAAAAQQLGDSAGQAGRVLVIDVGARATTVALVTRVGEHFELSAPAREVPVGGDRIDLHIAWLATGANPGLRALKIGHDARALESFFASVRDAKQKLCTAEMSTVRASVSGVMIEAEIWRDWLDQPVAGDIRAIAGAAEPLLAMRPDVVLLVGGGARFPAVAKSVRAAIPAQLEFVDTAGPAAGGLKQMLAMPAPEVAVASAPPAALSGWTLGIDFGTTYTVVAVATGGRTRPIDVDRQGSLKMPSSVVRIEDGTLVVGKHAVNQAVLYPTSYVETPKRDIGSGIKLLGGEAVPVVDLIAAVLKRCGDEVRKQQGCEPAAVRLTHPAKWSGPRLEALREAASKAGLGEPELIAEPVAAASMLPASVAQAGKPIAIYDFGGGTFDAAVLVPTPSGTFVVAGVPGGRDRLGGEDIDDRIIAYLGAGPLGQRPEWESLMTSDDSGWSRHRGDLRARVRDAKEQLSQQYEATIWIAGLRENQQLTRTKLQELIDTDVDDTVTELESTISTAGFSPADLGGIYLIGGSSQLSLVTEKIVDRFGIEPHPIAADAKTVVAEGAALWAPQAPKQQGTGSYRPCRIGARPFTLPGVTYRVEHLLSIDAESASVLSTPNRWLSLEAYVADQQQRDMQQGLHFGPPHPGSALGVDGAMLFPTTATDGQTYWSSYQLIGDWALRGRWLQDADGIAQIRVITDASRWSAMRSLLEFAERDGLEPVETITVYARPGKIPVDVVARARSEPLTGEQAGNWLQMFFYQLIQQAQGKVDPPLDTTFWTGAPCKAVKYRGSGKRGWCWYGIVNQRGVSITIKAPLMAALPMQMVLALRDAIVFE